MGRICLLDCTLRDGGYINDWNFGREAIGSIERRIGQAGIEAFEVGFIKDCIFSMDRTVYPDMSSVERVFADKSPVMSYLGMVDMGAPVALDRIGPRTERSLDGIRVIFKKDRIGEGCEYCRRLKEMGYAVFAQLVGTDAYSDREFLEAIDRFNAIDPDVLSIVDTFGSIRRTQFLRLVYLADHNMHPCIALGYHSHNNLQQAFDNARSMIELNLNRDVYVDACVFGMGRGAGNLNLELFAEYLNNAGKKSYKLEPIRDHCTVSGPNNGQK